MLEQLEGLLRSNARKYAYGSLEPDDLYHEQVVKVLELQAKIPATAPFFIQTVVRSCRNACIDLYRKEKVRGATSLESVVEDEPGVIETTSDGSFEKYRRELEFNERFALLHELDKRVATELVDPSPTTARAEQEEADAIFMLALEGKPVRNRSSVESKARHVAQGLRLPITEVKKSVGRLKTAFA